MIVMKIGGKKGPVKGDCDVPGFVDWITLESFDFGTSREIKSAERGGGRDIEEDTGETSDVSISKNIDVSTVELMYMSLEHRSAKDGGAGPEPLTVDVAFLAPFVVGAGPESQLMAYLRIRFGKALIKSWSIEGSSSAGEVGRPTEDITLWYNQVAIAYKSSPDGKNYKIHGPRGWDQGAQKDWPATDLSKF